MLFIENPIRWSAFVHACTFETAFLPCNGIEQGATFGLRQGWVDLELGCSSKLSNARTVLSDFFLPKQNLADSATPETKSMQPSLKLDVPLCNL